MDPNVQQPVTPGQVLGPDPNYQQPSQQPQAPNQQFAQPGQQTPLPTLPTPPPQNLGAVTGGSENKKTKLIGVVIIAVVVIALIIGAVLVFGKKKAPVKKATNTSASQQSKGPLPATALDVEQSNNAINQDISGLNDEKDFPADQLDDKPLGL